MIYFSFYAVILSYLNLWLSSQILCPQYLQNQLTQINNKSQKVTSSESMLDGKSLFFLFGLEKLFISFPLHTTKGKNYPCIAEIIIFLALFPFYTKEFFLRLETVDNSTVTHFGKSLKSLSLTFNCWVLAPDKSYWVPKHSFYNEWFVVISKHK